MQLLQGSNCAGHDWKFTEVVKSQSCVLTMLWRKYQPILKLILSQIRLCKQKCAKKVCHHVFKLYFHLIHLLINVWPCQAKNNHHEWSFCGHLVFSSLNDNSVRNERQESNGSREGTSLVGHAWTRLNLSGFPQLRDSSGNETLFWNKIRRFKSRAHWLILFVDVCSDHVDLVF